MPGLKRLKGGQLMTDVRFEGRDEPKIAHPTDAIIRVSATCGCGSDLWPYRGIQTVTEPTAMGHEYCGTVEEGGPAVRMVKPGQLVIGSFFASDNTCPHCLAGYHSSCEQRELVHEAQASRLRVPLADGTCQRETGSDDAGDQLHAPGGLRGLRRAIKVLLRP